MLHLYPNFQIHFRKFDLHDPEDFLDNHRKLRPLRELHFADNLEFEII